MIRRTPHAYHKLLYGLGLVCFTVVLGATVPPKITSALEADSQPLEPALSFHRDGLNLGVGYEAK